VIVAQNGRNQKGRKKEEKCVRRKLLKIVGNGILKMNSIRREEGLRD
jgi:hypothetical protein